LTEEEIKGLARRFLRSCEDFRVRVDRCDPKRAKVGPNVIRFYVRLADGQPLKPLYSHLNDIERQMQRSGLMLSTIPDSDEVALDVPRRQSEDVLFEQALPLLPFPQTPEHMPITIGVTPEGDPVIRDLGQMPHLLVGGTTGSGKTIFLYGVIASLLHTHPDPLSLRIFLSSSGLDDFFFFEGLAHLEGGEVVTGASRTLELLQTQIIQEFEGRGRMLASAHCRDIGEYNQRWEQPLAPLVVIIDEFADLADQLGSDRAAKQAFYDNIRRIAQMGRKRGVHLILCTQRPSANLVPTDIRTLMNARAALRVNDGDASRMILEESGAERLQEHGDMLFKETNRIIHARAYHTRREVLEEIIVRVNSTYP
jgi:DNA segregation ATPase FtsK/SpoIIIE-like protein